MQEFVRPSDPSQKIYLKEADVSLAMEFSDVLDTHSEMATTKFLNAVQRPEHYTDALKWTVGDRITALIWYFAHTTKDLFVQLPYDCGHCGEEHYHRFDVRELTKEHKTLKGKSQRDGEHLGRRIVFSPIKGEGMEAVQNVRIQSAEPDSKKTTSKMKLERLLWSFEFLGKESTRQERLDWVMSMTVGEYRALASKNEQAQAEMTHGIPFNFIDGDVCLPTPVTQCINAYRLPEEKRGGAVTRLHWPFLGTFFIPKLD